MFFSKTLLAEIRCVGRGNYRSYWDRNDTSRDMAIILIDEERISFRNVSADEETIFWLSEATSITLSDEGEVFTLHHPPHLSENSRQIRRTYSELHIKLSMDRSKARFRMFVKSKGTFIGDIECREWPVR